MKWAAKNRTQACNASGTCVWEGSIFRQNLTRLCAAFLKSSGQETSNRSFWKERAVHRTNRSQWIAGAVALLLIAIAVPAAHANSPEWLRAVAAKPAAKYADDTEAVVLLDEQILNIKENGETRTIFRRAYKILRTT